MLIFSRFQLDGRDSKNSTVTCRINGGRGGDRFFIHFHKNTGGEQGWGRQVRVVEKLGGKPEMKAGGEGLFLTGEKLVVSPTGLQL